ncbi:MAG: hypothetical protein WCH84_03020 [Verrucomicrobiota bacterium]
MKAGNSEFIIWLIVAVVVLVAKGLGKLVTTPEQEVPASPPRRPPQQKPVVRHTARRTVVEATSPVIQPTTVIAEKKSEPSPVTAPPVKPSRSNQWATALRDRQNIRNMIIANEIIGRPVSLREL